MSHTQCTKKCYRGPGLGDSTTRFSPAPCKAGLVSTILSREPFTLSSSEKNLTPLHSTISFQMLQNSLVDKVFIIFPPCPVSLCLFNSKPREEPACVHFQYAWARCFKGTEWTSSGPCLKLLCIQHKGRTRVHKYRIWARVQEYLRARRTGAKAGGGHSYFDFFPSLSPLPCIFLVSFCLEIITTYSQSATSILFTDGCLKRGYRDWGELDSGWGGFVNSQLSSQARPCPSGSQSNSHPSFSVCLYQ